jgi:hypothetical protein
MQYITNCEDLSHQVLEPSIEQHMRALVLLDVSQQQLQRLAGGHAVFKGILTKCVIQEMHKEVRQQQKDQQQQPQQAASAPDCTESSSSSSSPSQDGSSFPGLLANTTAAAAATAHMAIRTGLWKQEEATKRLETLLRTDTRTRAAVTAFMFGTLTWAQLAELHVVLYPFAPHPGMLARAAVLRLQQLQTAAEPPPGVNQALKSNK